MPIDFSPYQAVLLDLDGTILREDQALPGAVELIARLQREGRTIACISNSTISPDQMVDRLAGAGMKLRPDQVYTAAEAACDYVANEVPAGRTRKPRVFNLASAGVYEMLSGRAEMIEAADGLCDVVIGGSPSNEFATEPRQRIALQLLRSGAALIGICADRVFPSPRGIEFGCGALSAMLGYAANVRPIFCGKPERIFFVELCRRLRVEPPGCVLIGDNLESDIAGARAVGMHAILTLSGITGRAELQRLSATAQPDAVIDDLTQA